MCAVMDRSVVTMGRGQRVKMRFEKGGTGWREELYTLMDRSVVTRPMTRVKVCQERGTERRGRPIESERPIEIPSKRCYWLKGESFVVLLFFDPSCVSAKGLTEEKSCVSSTEPNDKTKPL